MNFTELIPAAEAIPMKQGWFHFFLITGFMLHILFVNLMIGGGVISLFALFSGKESLLPVRRVISRKMTVIFALAVNFGVLPFLFLQILYGQFIYVSSQLMAVYWLLIVLLAIAAYYSSYYSKFTFDSSPAAEPYFCGLTLLLLLFIAFIFSNNMTLMLNPKTWPAWFGNPDGTLLHLSDPALFPRYLHFMTASVAVAGLFIALMQRMKKPEDRDDKSLALGMKFFTAATLFQIPAGFWFQMSLPRDIMYLFLGNSPVHTALFTVSLLLIIQILYFGMKKAVWPAAVSLLILVFAMINIRDAVRTAYLDPYFHIRQIPVETQFFPFIIFAVSLFVTAAVIVYVLNLAKNISVKKECDI
ncbi:MAG: hypothetical protein V2I97_00855 [Desulfococcaceae bacterium]|jgi:hypothetical protein|nr:hypothetical protein [Desulfococcaceae bacterium]